MAHLLWRSENHVTEYNFAPGVQLKDLVQNLTKVLAIEIYPYKLSFRAFFFQIHLAFLLPDGERYSLSQISQQLLSKHNMLCSCLSAAQKCQLQNKFNLADENPLQATVTYLNKAVLKHTENKTYLCLVSRTHFELFLYIGRNFSVVLENVTLNKHQKKPKNPAVLPQKYFT